MTEPLEKDQTDTELRVRQIVEEVILNSPLFVVEVSVKGRTGSRSVNVFVDSDQHLDVDELARLSREVGFILETEEVIEGGYALNVSSPGVDRPLSIPRQYKKNVGRKLKVTWTDGEEEKTHTGQLSGATEDGIELNVPKGNVLTIPYSSIKVAKVQLPW